MAGYFESLTRIHENPQCPCFRCLNTLYPSINQDRSSGRHRRCGTTIAPSRRVASGRLRVNRPTWYSTPYPPLPVHSHSIYVHGTPHSGWYSAREEGLSSLSTPRGIPREIVGVCRATCCGDDDVCVPASLPGRVERQPRRYVIAPGRHIAPRVAVFRFCVNDTCLSKSYL